MGDRTDHPRSPCRWICILTEEMVISSKLIHKDIYPLYDIMMIYECFHGICALLEVVVYNAFGAELSSEKCKVPFHHDCGS